jgi:hypothetical protein
VRTVSFIVMQSECARAATNNDASPPHSPSLTTHGSSRELLRAPFMTMMTFEVPSAISHVN